MNRRTFLRLGAAGAMPPAGQAAPAATPNIVFILADDLGYGDLGCYGETEVKTPHLDRMAAEGIRFTDFHVTAPLCGPSRSSFLTGRYPHRNGLFTNIRNDMVNYGYRYSMLDYATSPEMTLGLDLREVTIAQLIQQAGYATGIVGKWDSGRDLPCLPLQRGFGFYYGFANTGIDYWTHERYGVPSMFRGNELIKEQGYATDLFRREALAFIDRNRNQPFFLYVPFNAPHGPSNLEKTGPQAPEEYIRLYGNQPGSARMRYLANITCLDAAVGAILEKLREHQLERNTLVVFASDNGGTSVGRNRPLRGTKGQMYEGGIRVPLLARWPGRIRSGAVSQEFTSMLDLFPTFVKLTGGRTPQDRIYDGHDILPVLTEGTRSPRTQHCWEWVGARAARAGQWKWVLESKRGQPPSEESPGELFDLSADVGERTDLAARYPDILRMVRAQWVAWMNEMARSEPRGPFSRDYFRVLGFPR